MQCRPCAIVSGPFSPYYKGMHDSVIVKVHIDQRSTIKVNKRRLEIEGNLNSGGVQLSSQIRYARC